MAGTLAAIAVALSLRSGAAWAQGEIWRGGFAYPPSIFAGDRIGPGGRIGAREREIAAVENREGETIEAVRALLSDRVVVAGLALEAGGRAIEAEIARAEEARERYREAALAGRQAVLLEQQGGALVQHIAAICPGNSAHVWAEEGPLLGRPVRLAAQLGDRAPVAWEGREGADPEPILSAHASVRAGTAPDPAALALEEALVAIFRGMRFPPQCSAELVVSYPLSFHRG